MVKKLAHCCSGLVFGLTGREGSDGCGEFSNGIKIVGIGDFIAAQGDLVVEGFELGVILLDEARGCEVVRNSGTSPLAFDYPEVKCFAMNAENVCNLRLREVGLDVEALGTDFFVEFWGIHDYFGGLSKIWRKNNQLNWIVKIKFGFFGVIAS